MQHPLAASVCGVLADGHVNAVLMKHGRGDDLRGANVQAVVVVPAALALVAVVIRNGLAVAESVVWRVAVVGPDLLHLDWLFRHLVECLEGVADSVAATEEDQRPAVDHAQRRRRPLAMEHPATDPLTVGGGQPARRLVQHDHTGGVGRDDFQMRPVDTVGSARVEQVAVNQHGATGGVVRADAQLVDHVEQPDDVGVGGRQLDRRPVGTGHVSGFVGEGTVVPVGLAVNVQASHLAGTGDNVDAVSVDGR